MMGGDLADIDLFSDEIVPPKKKAQQRSRPRKTKPPKKPTDTSKEKRRVTSSFDEHLSSLYENIKIRNGPIKASSEPGTTKRKAHVRRRNSVSNTQRKRSPPLLCWNASFSSQNIDYNYVPDIQLEHYAQCFQHALQQQQQHQQPRWSSASPVAGMQQRYFVHQRLHTTYARGWLEQWFESSLSKLDLIRIVNLVTDGVYTPAHRYDGRITCAEFCVIMHLCSLCQMPSKCYRLPPQLPQELHPRNAVLDRLKHMANAVPWAGAGITSFTDTSCDAAVRVTHRNTMERCHYIGCDHGRAHPQPVLVCNGKSSDSHAPEDDDDSRKEDVDGLLLPAAGGSDDEEGVLPRVAANKRGNKERLPKQHATARKRNGVGDLFSDDDDDVVARNTPRKKKLKKTDKLPEEADGDAVVQFKTQKYGSLPDKTDELPSGSERSPSKKRVPARRKFKSPGEKGKESPVKRKRVDDSLTNSSQARASTSNAENGDDEVGAADKDDDSDKKRREAMLKKLAGGVNTVKKRRNIKQVKQFSTTQRALLEQEQARLNTLRNDDDKAASNVSMLADVDAELRDEIAPSAEADVLSPIDALLDQLQDQRGPASSTLAAGDEALPSSLEQLGNPVIGETSADDYAAKFKALLDDLPEDDADDVAGPPQFYHDVDDHFNVDPSSPYRGNSSPFVQSSSQHDGFTQPKSPVTDPSDVFVESSPSAANPATAEQDEKPIKRLKDEDAEVDGAQSVQSDDIKPSDVFAPSAATVTADVKSDADDVKPKTEAIDAAIAVTSPAESNTSDEIEIVEVKSTTTNLAVRNGSVHVLDEKSNKVRRNNSVSHRGDPHAMPHNGPQLGKRPALDGALRRNDHHGFSIKFPSSYAVPLGGPQLPRQRPRKNTGNFAYISGLPRDDGPKPLAAAKTDDDDDENHRTEQTTSSQSSSSQSKSAADTQNDCEIVGTSNANVVHDARLTGIHTDDAKNRPVDGKILININHPRRDPPLYCAEHLTQYLKPHQIGGLRFIYDNLIQNQTSYLKQPGYGAVLAHVMGLGKTLQVIAFLEVLFRHFAPLKDVGKKQQHVLLIVPVNCLHHWLEEFERWMPRTRRPKNMPVYYIEKSSMRDRIASVGSWHASGGVLLLGYEMFRQLTMCSQKISKHQKVMTADEFFSVKQETSKQTNALNSLLNGAHDEILDGTTAKIVAADAEKSKQTKKTRPKRLPKNSKNPTNGDAAKKAAKSVLSRKIKSDFDDDTNEVDDQDDDDAVEAVDSDSRDSADRDASSSEDTPPPPTTRRERAQRRTKTRARIEEESDDDDDGADNNDPAKGAHNRAVSYIMMHKADIVICDEGHRIKNHKSRISEALKHIRSKRRLILTGTPMQNNLSEYWCMVDFVRPGLLGSKKEFDGMFRMPIENGQCVDSTQWDVVLMLKRTYVLQKILMGVVQRRGYEVVKKQLPSKHETVIVVKQSKDQYKLARDVVRVTIEHLMQAQERINPLLMYAVFKKVFTHPCMFLRAVERLRSEMTLKAFQEEFGDDQALEGNQRAMRFAHIAFSKVFDPYIEQHMKPNVGKSYFASSMSPKLTVLRTILEHVAGKMDEKILVFTQSTQTLDWIEHCLTLEWKYFHVDVSTPSDKSGDGVVEINDSTPRPRRMRQVDMYSMLKSHGKLISAKKSTSNKTHTDGEEVVIEDSSDEGDADGVSQRTSQLKLDDSDAADSKPTTTNRRTVRIPWEPNRTYLRFDGQTSVRERTERIHKFNNSDDIVLFLISTEAGGIGVNLSAASRVILFDVCWNPSHDEQAIARVYRFGQTRSCHIYRLVTGHCMEERVFKRQIKKQTVSHRVVDQKNMQRCLTNAEVQQLISVDDYHASCGNPYDTADEDDEIIIDTSRNRGGRGNQEADEFDKQRVARAEDDRVMKAVYDSCAHLLSRQPFYVDSLLQIEPGSSLSDEDKKLAFDEYKRDTDPSLQPAARFYNLVAAGGDPAAAAAAVQNGTGAFPRVVLANNNGVPLPASAVYYGGQQNAAGHRGNFANRLPTAQPENDDIQIQYAQQKNVGAGTATGNANASGQRQYNFQTLLRQLLAKNICAWLEPGDDGTERLMLVNGETLMECEQGSGKLVPVRPMPATSSEFKRIRDSCVRQRDQLFP